MSSKMYARDMMWHHVSLCLILSCHVCLPPGLQTHLWGGPFRLRNDSRWGPQGAMFLLRSQGNGDEPATPTTFAYTTRLS